MPQLCQTALAVKLLIAARTAHSGSAVKLLIVNVVTVVNVCLTVSTYLQICALLAHLLFLRANGGTEYATALSDTFGSEAFIAAARVTQVPHEFIQDIQELYPDDRQLQSGMVSEHAGALSQ